MLSCFKHLGDILSKGLGIHDTHTISLYASLSLGRSTFTAIMKNVFEQYVCGDSINDFLTMMSVNQWMW